MLYINTLIELHIRVVTGPQVQICIKPFLNLKEGVGHWKIITDDLFG